MAPSAVSQLAPAQSVDERHHAGGEQTPGGQTDPRAETTLLGCRSRPGNPGTSLRPGDGVVKDGCLRVMRRRDGGLADHWGREIAMSHRWR
ncbi:MAG: hypothetical protein ACRD0H_20035, partial [Actinomycetes bacterium]